MRKESGQGHTLEQCKWKGCKNKGGYYDRFCVKHSKQQKKLARRGLWKQPL